MRIGVSVIVLSVALGLGLGFSAVQSQEKALPEALSEPADVHLSTEAAVAPIDDHQTSARPQGHSRGLDETAEVLKGVISTTKTSPSPWARLNQLGTESMDKSKYPDAQNYFMQAIRELKKHNEKDDRLIESRNNLDDAYYADNKNRDAQEAYEL